MVSKKYFKAQSGEGVLLSVGLEILSRDPEFCSYLEALDSHL